MRSELVNLITAAGLTLNIVSCNPSRAEKPAPPIEEKEIPHVVMANFKRDNKNPYRFEVNQQRNEIEAIIIACGLVQAKPLTSIAYEIYTEIPDCVGLIDRINPPATPIPNPSQKPVGPRIPSGLPSASPTPYGY